MMSFLKDKNYPSSHLIQSTIGMNKKIAISVVLSIYKKVQILIYSQIKSNSSVEMIIIKWNKNSYLIDS